MTDKATLHNMIRRGAERGEDSAALLGTDGFRLTWRELSTQIDGIAGFLAEGGIEPGNRVGIMLPNGPEMAVSFLSVASVAAAAPLNPSFTAEELRFYLADLGVAAVIGPREPGDAIRSVGASLGIPVHALSRAPASDAPGFLMDGQVVEAARAFRAPAPTDTALLLHTSGTTSRPKLVPLSHANLRASAGSIRRSLGLISGDRCLNIMPLFHIHGLVCALLASLDAGGSVVCTGGLVARHFISWLQEFRPTWYTAVPTMHQAVLQAVGEEGGVPEGHSLRLIRSSSSALPKPVLEDLGATFGVPVVEAYGMTEASHQMCSNPLPPAVSKPGSVGPAAGPEVAVMDELGVLQPRGVAGEVVIRGDSVTAGYHGNPEANARAFTDGWFRTGDEGYLDEDGYLFLSGRLKEIINRGGEKVAPRQVDDVLLEHPDVLQAVTFAVPHGTLGEDVLAAVMLREGSGTTERDLRHHAFSKLAASRVPSRIVLVDDIPKGPSGKLKRIGLSERLAHLIRPGHEPPTTDTERLLAAVWSEVLVIESETIGAHDNFFTLGGDSLSAARVRGRVLRALGVDVPLEQLFREPTVQTLATAIDALREAPGDRPAERRPARVGREAPRVLSPAQERTWFLNRFAPDNPGDNRPANLRLRGPIEIPVLRRCLDEIVRRHEALRTSFQEMDGQPIAVVEPGAVLALDVVDASEDGEGGEGSARFRELVRDEARRPFDLTVAPLLRTTLVRLGRDDHALLTTFHHIVFDAWSMEVFVRELSLLYEAFSQGKASPLPPLSIQYADYAAWQRAWLEGDEANRQLRYWLEHLADAPATSELPILGDRPPHQLYDGRSESVPLPAALWPAIDRLCEEWRVTRFMVFFAVFQALIHRYTGQDAIVIGTPAADRQVPESEELIGVFVNTLPIRTDVSGDPSFAELLERTRSVVLNGLAHLQVPFERIVEAVAPDRDLSRTPLFQLFCNYRNVPLYRRADGGLQIEEMSEAKEIANFDLALEIDDEPAGIRCTLVYNTHLFEAERVSRMAGHFLTLLEGAVADASTPVSALPMVVGEELRRMLVEWNDTGVDWPSDTLAHEAIAEQAARTPDAVAVVCGDHRVTYRELNETANQLARHLQGLGIARGGLVGVFLDRSVDMVVALLGIAKAGAAFLPLDPAYPRERLAHMIRDGAPSLVITEGGLAEALPQGDRPVLRIDENREDVAREDAGDLDSRSSRGDLAYIMYTSGSTGQPKGVMVEHGSLMNFLWAMREAPGVSASDTMLAVTPLSFDPCLLELFLPLTCGAKVKIVARSVAVNGYELARELDDPEVTLFQATPATLQMLMDAGWLPHESLRVLSGGERIPVVMARKLSRHAKELWNLYGPTETTLWATTNRCHPEDLRVSVGRPIANVRTYILDAHLRPVPAGVTGDLYIAGEGVARGYLNRRDLTGECFVPEPFRYGSASMMYRTGDRARFDLAGGIEFMGRADGQVKVRGCRIELGEIEAQLRKHEAVRDAVVILHTERDGFPFLVGYFVSNGDRSVTAQELRHHLKLTLPEYMVPAVFVPLTSLPITPSGKVDRRALPPPEAARLEVRSSLAAPRSELEKQVARVWREVLRLDDVGIHDDFFDLGGHSLLAVRVIARLKDAYGWDIPLAALFEYPTVAMLSGRIPCGPGGVPSADRERPILVGVHTDAPGPPLFCIPFFGDLARRMGTERPFHGAEPARLAELVATRGFDATVDLVVEEIKGARPEPPWLIAGFCGSAPFAFDVAKRLHGEGGGVALFALFEPVRVDPYTRWTFLDWVEDGWASLRSGERGWLRRVARVVTGGALRRADRRPGGGDGGRADGGRDPAPLLGWRRQWKPGPYPGGITVFWGDVGLSSRPRDVRRGWHRLALDGLDVRIVPGNHVTLLREPLVAHLAAELTRCIDAAEVR